MRRLQKELNHISSKISQFLNEYFLRKVKLKNFSHHPKRAELNMDLPNYFELIRFGLMYELSSRYFYCLILMKRKTFY